MSVLSKIKTMYSNFNVNAKHISKIANKSYFCIMFDMLFCSIFYSASPNNYEKFEFYKLDSKQRKSYFTYGLSKKMIKKFNRSPNVDLFENKLKFAEVFNDLFKREYLNVDNMSFFDFKMFCEGKDKFILKPYGGSQGQNIKVFKIGNIEEIFNEIKVDFTYGYMLEEWILQHQDLSRIYPDAVNCLRIITVFDGKEVSLITGGVTFATETEIANGSQPSIVSPINIETGELISAATFGSELFTHHPKTHEKIDGVILPYWHEVRELLDVACRRVPDIGYIGWDIAITPTGPVLIEGNTMPGYKYYQIPVHLTNGIGNKDKYINFLKKGSQKNGL